MASANAHHRASDTAIGPPDCSLAADKLADASAGLAHLLGSCRNLAASSRMYLFCSLISLVCREVPGLVASDLWEQMAGAKMNSFNWLVLATATVCRVSVSLDVLGCADQTFFAPSTCSQSALHLTGMAAAAAELSAGQNQDC